MTAPQPITDRRLSTFWTCMEKHRLEYEMGYRPSYAESGRLSRAWAPLANHLLSIANSCSDSGVGADVLLRDARLAIPKGYHWIDRAKLSATLEAAISVLGQGEFLQRHQVLCVGSPYRFEHLNPDTKASSPLWFRTGVIDAVVRHRFSKDLFLVKHLVTDEPIDLSSKFWDRVRMDNRVAADVVGAATRGHRVSGVVYMAASKCQMSPLSATPSDKRKYTVATDREPSRLYAGQRECDEKPAEFHERVRASIMSSPMDYFRTAFVPWDQRKTEAHLRDAWAASQMMRITRVNGWAPRNPDACHRFGTCPYWRVCCGQENPAEGRFRSSVAQDEDVPLVSIFQLKE